MPLPAALQARLQRRGIAIQKEEEKTEPELEPDFSVEEVVQPPPKKNYKHITLPPGWFKVPDPGKNSEYYWNVHTNQVSWRHPSDPRAEITYPACWQKKTPSSDDKEKEQKTSGGSKSDHDEKRKEEKSFKSNSKIKTGRHPSLMKAQRQKDRAAPYRKKKAADDALDPMDPASYSDVGRGTWSSGLREETETKTGVDTTANGPLFQQRPYPSPGDVLRRNRKAPQDAKSDDDDDDD